MEARISLCMMVKNEARLLGRCLSSAQSIAKQMVVVDTGSDDDSAVIAEAAGAEVHSWAWRDDFAAARNETLRHATGDWILILDGDEVLDGAAVEQIAALDLGKSAPAAYNFWIINYSTDALREDEATIQSQVRLFRNVPHHRYRGLVHNQLIDARSDMVLDGPQAEVRVHHHGYTPAVWSGQNKNERLALLERAVALAPEDLFARHNLANHLKILERYLEALAAYRFVIDHSVLPPASTWQRQSWFSAAFCALRVGRNEEALDLCDQLIAHEPGLADPHLRRAEALLELGRYEEVVVGLSALLADPRRHAVKRRALSWGVPYRLGRALFLLGRHAEALPHFAQLATREENDETVFTHLAICASKLGDATTAREAVQRALELAPMAEDVRELAATMGAAPRSGAATSSASASMARRRKAQGLVEQGRIDDARALLEDAVSADPGSAERHLDLGALLFQMGDTLGGIAHFLQAADLAPTDLGVLMTMLEGCFAAGAFVEALTRVERSLAIAATASGRRPIAPAAERSVRALIVGADSAGDAKLISDHTAHVAVLLAPGATSLPEADLIHVVGSVEPWPNIDWDKGLRGRAVLVQADGSFEWEPWLERGAVVVDSTLPPQSLGPRLEPIFDTTSIEPVCPPLPLRMFHVPANAEAQATAESAVADLPIELVSKPEGRLGCHIAWCPEGDPSTLLTSMALGQVVLAPVSALQRAVYPERPVFPAARAALELLADEPTMALALGRASRQWVVGNHGVDAVARRLSALYEYVLATSSGRSSH